MKLSHLDFVDGLPLLETLGPHRDAPLVVVHAPAFLAQTLRLKGGKRPVVRDGHSVSRHGSLPGEREEGGGGEERGALGDSCWARRRHGEPGENEEKQRRQPLLYSSAVGIICLIQFPPCKKLFAGCTASCDDQCSARVCVRVQGGATTAVQPVQTNETEVNKAQSRTGERTHIHTRMQRSVKTDAAFS